MSNFREMLEALGRFMNDEDETTEIPVGKIDEELIAEFRMLGKNKKNMREDIELFQKQIEIEVKRRFDEQFGERINEEAKQHKRLWSKVYETLQVDPEQRYTIDHETFIVSKIVDKDQAAEAKPEFKLFDFSSAKKRDSIHH